MRASRAMPVVLVSLLMAVVIGRAGAEERLIAGARAKDAVQLRDVRPSSDGTVEGVLANTTSHLIRDVRLMIHHNWLWKDEKHPGDDSPGRVEYFTVPTTIDPHGTIEFHYKPSPPLPTDRTDGHFDTTVEVVGYTEIG
jgi:hypothetical protein